MELPGKFTISRVQSNVGDDYIQIQFVEVNSGARFVAARIDLESFALAITGQASLPCDLDIRGLDRLGKKHEVKTEIVSYEGARFTDDLRVDPAAIAALAPYEVDGWKGRVEDLFNHHNRSGPLCRVTFDRWVDGQP
jgi:hypothetical protein